MALLALMAWGLATDLRRPKITERVYRFCKPRARARTGPVILARTRPSNFEHRTYLMDDNDGAAIRRLAL
jgi:hypothetical protein